MNREQIEELAALDALGALDGEDRSAWERLRATDTDASRLGDELTDIAARLSLLAAEVPAPAALRARVMDAVFGADPAESPAMQASDTSSSFGWSAWAAAAAIALLALIGTSGITRHKEDVVVRDARPGSHALFIPLAGYGDFSAVHASVLWDSGQRGWYVQAKGLPAIPSSHSYRVWAVCADGNLHDCGELPLRGAGTARRFVQPDDRINSMQGFLVSIEPAGRTPAAPTTPAVLISPTLLRSS